MKIFSIFVGASRIEFSVVFELGKYRGKVNDTVFLESVDYESVREGVTRNIDDGYWESPHGQSLH